MIQLLAGFFITPDQTPEKTRSSYGKLCGIVGIFFNILLFTGKFAAGIISGSVAITADAFNNLSDAGSSVTTLLGFRLAEQEPDREHPYGHGRFEYLAALVVSAVILIMALELFHNSVDKIKNPGETFFSPVLIGVLAVSILIKGYMFAYNGRYGKRFSSPVLRAASFDSISDCVTTSVVLVCTVVSAKTGLQLDGWAGVAVSLFIFYGGITSAKDAIDPLLGQKPSDEFVGMVKDIALSFDSRILGVHDLLVHDYGPGRRMISLHVEVPADGELLELHDVIDNLERKLATDMRCSVTIHMDPIVTDDPETDALHKVIEEIAGKISSEISIHDFRIVKGDTHTNLIFDMAVPYDVGHDDRELRTMMQDWMRNEGGEKYFVVINIDRY